MQTSLELIRWFIKQTMAAKPRSLRVEGIILRHREWGEADRLLTIYTRELGKIWAIAKGVRKPHSRKGGHLEPFMRSNLLLARGRTFYILTQAEAIASYLPLREDLILLGIASYNIELLDRFVYEEEENRALFRLLESTLDRLARGDDPDLVTRYYEIRLLDHVGFRPQLFRCVGCDEEIQPEDQFFSPLRGGAICPSCGQRETEARPVSLQALKYLRHFQRSSYRDATRANIGSATNKELENLMQYYFTYILERRLNSLDFLRHVRQRGS
ncbi:MAG: DNA repair protein RecO [Chloroflexota bacterium]|nr:DNA repair protein RecO [Chloroflexota bacterium]